MKEQKQPFYRNKVAMLLRCFSIASIIGWITVFLRGTYLYLILGWDLGFISTVYFIAAPFITVFIEMLHNKAVEYGNYLFKQKFTD
ncbi:hypothetical protein [Ligilactobacillus faecis]|uniref:hypothetical protein n=1 Tax=Ligilactobacillus faecis TaxID=762833 RepID=UPI002469887D|nr:hypothetical protein [Ligilactobacillus faecis]WGN89557.1 hypothetical protein QFX10_00155 [Ligilactobacillus faecis]